MQVVLVG
jgi:hypothetical protein